jgi:Gpi18-like mannosyltransferase
LIRACSWLAFGNHFAAGLLLANVLTTVAFLVFHYFVERHHGLPMANISVTLLLAYPGAIFFSFIYTESLFLLLVVLFFMCMFQERYVWVAALGFLLPLTKAVGVFCVFPLLVYLWMHRADWKTYLAFYGPVLGYATYFGIMHLATGNALEGFEAQRFFPN